MWVVVVMMMIMMMMMVVEENKDSNARGREYDCIGETIRSCGVERWRRGQFLAESMYYRPVWNRNSNSNSNSEHTFVRFRSCVGHGWKVWLGERGAMILLRRMGQGRRSG